MKIVKLTTNYSIYLNKFYNSNPSFLFLPYEEQKKRLLYDSFGWNNFWKSALSVYGYETVDLITNVKPLQIAWAKENDVKFQRDQWVLEITKEQIKEEKPDILFIDDYSTFKYGWIQEVRRSCPTIKLILGWCGAPFSDIKVFKSYDIVLSCIPELVEQFRSMGHRSQHINHSFNPEIIKKINMTNEKDINFSFIGSITLTNKYHKKRYMLLKKISRQLNIDIFSPSFEAGAEDMIMLYIIKQRLINLSITKRLNILNNYYLEPYTDHDLFIKSAKAESNSLKTHAGVFGLDMFQMLRKSKLTLNSHIEISSKSASNMRLFEATGVGTCLLTDYKENLSSLFDADKEIVTYKTAEECAEKAKWLLNNPKKAEEIASAGQKRTLKEHTCFNRASVLNDIIRSVL